MSLSESRKVCHLLALIILSTFHSLSSGMMISTTEASSKGKEGISDYGQDETTVAPGIPEIYEMYINTTVINRYATTLITSKVRNTATKAQEAIFFVVLPDKAFISEFVMEIRGKSYKAYVKEKEEAKDIYNKAVSSGLSAAHVEVSARDSNKFTVSLNLEPESKAIFKLTYEEFLTRRKGKYEIVLNIHPGQIVQELQVDVTIDETVPLKFVRTPLLRSGNEIEKNRDELKSNAEIISIDSTSSIVKFYPNREEQRKFTKALDTKEEDGIKGQFVVEYDVERNTTGGEVLLNDGYFVHFFAPEDIETMAKQVVFVLDISGSMWGTKMQQLIDAMVHILDELKPQDSFSIVAFDTTVNIWNTGSGWINLNLGYESRYGQLENGLRLKEIPLPIIATPENIAKAKSFVKTIGPRSLTNIIGGLEVGLFIVKKAQQDNSEFRQPLLVFLTDGQANVGISNADAITNLVAKLNPKEKQTPIFSLSFGIGADKAFLRKLSSQNLGFSRHIYEGADASLQLQDFYQMISSPLMRDVTFEYTKDATVATNNHIPIFFRGSEFIVAGKIPMDSKNEYIIEGWRPGGTIMMKPKIIKPVNSLERLWAFLNVQQILEKRDVVDKKDELTKKAVDLALKYSFVTPVTSLVVVKPNATDAVNTEDAFDTHHTDYPTLPIPSYGGGERMYSFLLTPMTNFNGGRIGSNSLSMHHLGAPPGMGTRQSLYYPTGLSGDRNRLTHRTSMNKHVISTRINLKRGGGRNRFTQRTSMNRHFKAARINRKKGGGGNIFMQRTSMDRHFTSPQFNRLGGAPPRRSWAVDPIYYIPTVSTTLQPNINLPVSLPELEKQEWFRSISNRFTIKIPQAETYKLATNETVVNAQTCARTVLNKAGSCTLIHQCQTAIPFLTDLPTFLRYFCPLGRYAGICCDI